MAEIRQLVRVYRRAESIGLGILSCYVREALRSYAHKDKEGCRERLCRAIDFCEIAMSGTNIAQLNAPGFKAVISRIVNRMT